MLALCDRFRDEDLVTLGVQLDDGQGAGEHNPLYPLPLGVHHLFLPSDLGKDRTDAGIDGGALYKLVDPSILLRAREEKAAAQADKVAKKAANAAAAEAKRIEQLEKGRVPPVDMFKPPNIPQGIWGAWDEQGLPTHDGEGNEISKSAAKKVGKEWNGQKKAHETFLAWQREGGK